MRDASSYHEIFLESIQQERERIAFIEHERSPEEAQAFAERIRTAYRRAVVSRSPPAGDPTFRLRLMGSYCAFKRYLARR